MKSRWLKLLAVLLALAVLAAACGNDDDDVTAGEDDAPAATEAPTDDSDSEEPVEPVTTDESAEEPTEGLVPTGNTGYINPGIRTTECIDDRPRGGELVMGTFGEIIGFDPTTIQGGAALGGQQLTALYDALFYLDQTTGDLIPGLAESITSQDNRVFTLKLREGITFTDGTPLDAEAFIWNVEHHQDPDRGSESRQEAILIESVVPLDDYTVEITATGVNATFPQIFARRMAWMVSPTVYEAVGAEGVNINPVGAGAGPFMFESWIQDDEAVLVRNPDYFREGCPYLDRLVFKPIMDPAQRYNAFNAGDLDIAFDRNPNNLNDARVNGVNTTTWVINHGGYWMLNNDKEPFNVQACRVAVAHAVDYDTLNEVVWDGLKVLSRSLMKEGSPWLNPNAVLPGYDPDAAAAALAECEAELGGPLEFETLCTTSPENVLLTETLVAMWQEAGISATANCVEVGEMVTAVFSGEAVANPWSIPVDDPDYMHSVYTGDSTIPGECGPNVSNRNWSKTCHPVLDETLQAGREGLTFEERYDAYARFQELFAELVPVIILDKAESGYYWDDDVSGIFLTETGINLLTWTAKG